MKVTQEKLPDSQLGLEIEIPGELSQQVYDQTLSKLSREVSLPGFRKGKVPRHILVQRLGSGRIKATAIEDLIQKGLDQAIDKEKIEALGNYQLKSSFDDLIAAFEPGKPLSFAAAVDVPPTPSLKGYKGISVKAEEVKYDPDRVDKVLADYQKQLATLVPVEGRAAQADDVATIDFKGHLDLPEDAEAGAEPEEIPGGSAEDFQVELGEGKFIPGFIEGMMGMKVDETRKVPATFPEDYPQEEVAGKQASFEITLKELKTRELPELNDDFAQEVSDFDTLQELRESLEKRYKDEADQKTKENKQEALSKAMAALLEVELPETMVQRESNQLLTQTLMRLSDQGMDVNKIFNQELADQFRKQVRPEAIERLKRTLSLGEVAKAESIAVDDAAVQAKMDEVLENTTQDQANIDLDRLRGVVKEDLLKDAIMDWLEANGTVELLPEGSLSAEAEAAEAEAAEAEAAEANAETEAEPESAKPAQAKSSKPKAEGQAEAVEAEAEEPAPKAAKPKAEKKDEAKADQVTEPEKKASKKKPKKS
jgi:trigger factor